MFFLSDSAIGEAVGNAKRERSERGAFSVAVAMALSGSLAIDVSSGSIYKSGGRR